MRNLTKNITKPDEPRVHPIVAILVTIVLISFFYLIIQ